MGRRALWLCCTVLACATSRPAPPAAQAPYPDPPSVHLFRGDFLWRQHVVAHYSGREIGFDAVLQKRGETLVLVGLTPFGTRAFELTRVGDAVRFQKDLPMELPFPPKYIFDDLARTYFSGLSMAALADGIHTTDVAGERVTEVWQGGLLLRRSFVRVGGAPSGEIRIDYVGGMAGEQSPERIEFENGWFGYHLTIVTTSQQSL